MTDEEIKTKIFDIFSRVMSVSPDKIFIDSSPDTVPEWTSVKSMNLVVALEQEFSLQLTDEQIMEMMNMELVVKTITGAIAENK